MRALTTYLVIPLSEEADRILEAATLLRNSRKTLVAQGGKLPSQSAICAGAVKLHAVILVESGLAALDEVFDNPLSRGYDDSEELVTRVESFVSAYDYSTAMRAVVLGISPTEKRGQLKIAARRKELRRVPNQWIDSHQIPEFCQEGADAGMRLFKAMYPIAQGLAT